MCKLLILGRQSSADKHNPTGKWWIQDNISGGGLVGSGLPLLPLNSLGLCINFRYSDISGWGLSPLAPLVAATAAGRIFQLEVSEVGPEADSQLRGAAINTRRTQSSEYLFVTICFFYDYHYLLLLFYYLFLTIYSTVNRYE